MAKALGSVLGVLMSPLSIIDKKLGQIVSGIGLTVIGAVTGNVALISLGIGQLASGLSGGPRTAKPETTETTIKTPRPSRVRAYGVSRLYGASAAFEGVDGSTIDVYAVHDGRAAAVRRVYLNDNQVTLSGNTVQPLEDKSYQGGHVKVGYTLGANPNTHFTEVQAVLPDWDASHRGDGVVTAYLIKGPEEDEHFLETYPQGDNVELSLVGEWTPVFDPRDPAQDPYNEATWQHSENAVLALVHYLMVHRGYDWERRFEPQLARLITAIDLADEDVPLAAGGTEKRYRTALSYKATEAPAAVIASLLACFDGWYCLNEQGHVVVYAGAAYTPTVSVGPEHIVSHRDQINVEYESRINLIAVPYVSDQHDYNTVDAQPWTDEDDISARGREVTDDLGAAVPSHTQGRRLAKAKMARANSKDRGTITTTFAGSMVLGERFINLRVEEAGALFFDGVAEIVTPPERDLQTGGVTFDWVAYDPNTHVWNPETEDGEPAPTANRYAPAPLATPVIVSATPEIGSGSARVRIIAEEAPVPAVTWYARWRIGAGAWNSAQYPDLDAGPPVEILTGIVSQSDALQVAVQYRATDGRASPWSAAMAVNTAGDTGAEYEGLLAPNAVAITSPVPIAAGDEGKVEVRIGGGRPLQPTSYTANGSTTLTLVAAPITEAPPIAYTVTYVGT